ncbi:MAG TPA: PQQ-dependent sugar dehydrogenase [Chryseolinea sp.]|nr:PQQ-dependent sugar dehydrogenase [Chryseolinea sp.]
MFQTFNSSRVFLHTRSAAILFLLFFACKDSKTLTDNKPPEENRFTTTVLTKPGKLDEPMEMAFLNDGKILFVEQKGTLKVFDPQINDVKTISKIPVNTKYTSKEGRVTEAEEGLMGLVVHPDFDKNYWIYMYYADTAETKHVLARWELHGDSLYASTKKIVLEIPTQRETCCHTGGGMVFDKEGNLYLTVGNNTGNPVSGTSALDERPDRSSWDDQRTAGNTNDLRGKILRIHPERDGTYSIPSGNLFPKGAEKTRPEIYTMGHRNPWRVSVDSENGYIYWGEVGPDASKDSIIGPRGYDEFNQAREAGFFGWPYFIGDNKAYSDFDYATEKVEEKFDVAHPVNNSPNNTGLTDLPAPQKAFIWYPYATSEEFPLVGSAGRSATGGPVFRMADFKNAKHPFPAYFEGKWLAVEFMRGWIMRITIDDDGNYKSMEKFLPNENFSSAIDMKYGPDGDLYVLEYGSAWFRGNDNAQIVKFEYNGGNRRPVVKVNADKLAGSLPLKVDFSSQGTIDYDDYDKDALKYEWTIKSDNGFSKTFTEPNPSVVFDKAGLYNVSFTTTDTKGEKNTASLQVKAGNDPPVVDIELLKGNKTFFFDKVPIEYDVKLTDKEDGSLSKGISANEVALNFDYVPEGFDLIEIAQNHRSSDAWATFSTGANLIGKGDCKSCHIIDKRSVGPSYLEIAKRYKNNSAEQERIANKIIVGGSGVWGDHAMSAHPSISPQDAATMINYIMSLAEKKSVDKSIPLKGTFVPHVPAGDNGRGGYLLRAAYKDKGTQEMESLTSEKIVALRNPALDPERSDLSKGTQLMTTPSRSFSMVGNSSYLAYNKLDLTGIKQVEFLVQAQPRSGALGGIIEIHLDSPNGKIVGQTDTIVPKDIDFRKARAALMPKPDDTKQKKGGATAPPKAAPPIDFSLLRKLMSVHATAPIEQTDGIHDVYFVFKNPQATTNQIIVQMVEIQFQNSVPKPIM